MPRRDQVRRPATSPSPVSPEPKQPGETEWIWIGVVLTVVVGGVWVDFLFSHALTIPYLIGAGFLALAAIIIAPHGGYTWVWRGIAFLVSSFLVWFILFSGSPLIVAEAASPVGQNLHDGPNGVDNLGNLVTGLVPFIIVVGLIVSVVLWLSKSPGKILASSVVGPLALFPFLAIIAQELVKHPWH